MRYTTTEKGCVNHEEFPYVLSQFDELWPPNGWDLIVVFDSLSCHCQRIYTEVTERESAKLCYTFGSEPSL